MMVRARADTFEGKKHIFKHKINYTKLTIWYFVLKYTKTKLGIHPRGKLGPFVRMEGTDI